MMNSENQVNRNKESTKKYLKGDKLKQKVKRCQSERIVKPINKNNIEMDDIEESQHDFLLWIRSPTVQSLSKLRQAIQKGDKLWMLDFLHYDGLGLLFQCLSRMSGRTHMSDLVIRLQCVTCLREVVNSQIGMNCLLSLKDTFNTNIFSPRLASALDTENSMVKMQIMEILAAVCMFSHNGFCLVLDVLHNYKARRKFSFRFSFLLKEIRKPEVPSFKCSIMGLINAIVVSNDNIHDRMRIRNEFISLGMLETIDQLLTEKDPLLNVQCDVFEEELCADEEEIKKQRSDVNLNDPDDVFRKIHDRVINTPMCASFLSILQNLLLVDSSSNESELVWLGLERILQKTISDENNKSVYFMDCGNKKDKFVQTDCLADEREKLSILRNKYCQSKDKNTLNSELNDKLFIKSDADKISMTNNSANKNEISEVINTSKTDLPVLKYINEDTQQGKSTLPPPPPPPPPLHLPCAPLPHQTSGVSQQSRVQIVPSAPPLPTIAPITQDLLLKSQSIPPPPPAPNIPIFPQGLNTNVPPPPPPFVPSPPTGMGCSAQPQLKITTIKVPKPNKKMKLLTWTKISPSSNENVWRDVSEMKDDIEVKYNEIENLFSLKQTASLSIPQDKPFRPTSPTPEIMLIDAKKSMNLNIFLKQFRTKHYTEVIDLLTADNDREFTVDRLKSLQKLLPSNEEVETLNSFNGEDSHLGTAEKFYQKLIEVPNYRDVISAMILKADFKSQISDIQNSVAAVSQACTLLIENVQLKALLKYILHVGNFINEGSNSGGAPGFRVTFLTKLPGTRSNAAGVTLLHYIVDQMMTSNSDSLSFLENLIDVLSKAIRNPIDGVESDYQLLKKNLCQVKQNLTLKADVSNDKFRTFFEHSEEYFEEIDESLSDLKENKIKLARYYCENEKNFRINDFLVTFSDFCNNIRQCQQEIEIRKRNEEKCGHKNPEMNSKPDKKIVDRLIDDIKQGKVLRRLSMRRGKQIK